MTTTTTRNLAREVAMVLGVKLVELNEPEILDWYEPFLGKQVHIEKWFYVELLGKNISGTWDTEDNAWEHAEEPDYPNDLNACARDLTREGYELVIHQRNHASRGKWFAQYINDNTINAFTGWADSPAIAICEAFLALCKYVDGQLAKGEQS